MPHGCQADQGGRVAEIPLFSLQSWEQLLTSMQSQFMLPNVTVQCSRLSRAHSSEPRALPWESQALALVQGFQQQQNTSRLFQQRLLQQQV